MAAAPPTRAAGSVEQLDAARLFSRTLGAVSGPVLQPLGGGSNASGARRSFGASFSTL